jgi:UTP--glucose-1-phosphate uridylyltransferase
VADLGTRFLPATKAPQINAAGGGQAVGPVRGGRNCGRRHHQNDCVTGRDQCGIEDPFDWAYKLEAELERRGKQDRVEQGRGLLPCHVMCI